MRRLFDPARTIGSAVWIAGGLARLGYRSEAEYVFREAAAPLAGSRALRPALRLWSSFTSPHVTTRDPKVGLRLHRLARDLATSGHRGEAVRVLTVALRHLGADEHAIEDVEDALEKVRLTPGRLFDAAESLERQGIEYLREGRPEGVTLLAGAHRVSPRRPWRFGEVSEAIWGFEPVFHPGYSGRLVGAYQSLATTAHRLSWLGQYEPAVSFGTLAHFMSEEPLHVTDAGLMWTATGAVGRTEADNIRRAAELSGVLKEKGYPGEAAELFATAVKLAQPQPRAAWFRLSEISPETLGAKPGVTDRIRVWRRSLFDKLNPSSTNVRFEPIDFGYPPWADPPRSGRLPEPARPGKTLSPRSRFYFALKGKRAVGSSVERGTNADFSFRYGVPDSAAVAEVTGTRLAAEGNLDLEVIPHGYTLRDGQTRKRAVFEKGRLRKPVVFFLRADAAPRSDAGVDVLFRVGGAVIYENFFELPIVQSVPTASASTPHSNPVLIDLDDVMAAKGRERDYSVTITRKGGVFRVVGSWPGEAAKTKTSDVTATHLQGLINRISTLLADIAEEIVFNVGSEPLNPSISEAIDDAPNAYVDRLLRAGWLLFSELKKDKAFGPVLSEIETLQPGAQSRLNIWTDSVFLPWSIMYPIEFPEGLKESQKAERRDVQRLWGYRFDIECLYSDPPDADALVRGRRRVSPIYSERSVTLCLNPDIGKELDAEDPYKPMVANEAFIAQDLQGIATPPLVGYEQTLSLFNGNESSDATFVYFYCHGQAPEPFASTGIVEALEMEDDRLINPDMFLTRPDRFTRRPIVLLNSCRSGAFSPLVFTSFLGEFRSNGAEGIIASAFPLPIKFAAAYGQEVMRRYLGGTPIGKVLMDLRRELLDRKNPLGFFYTLNCPLDLRVKVAA